MERNKRIFFPKALIFVVIVSFLTGCSTFKKGAEPTSEPTPTAKPTVVEPKKEEPTKTAAPKSPTTAPTESKKSPPPAPSTPPAASKETPAPVLRLIQVVWSSVNLREGPGMNYKVIGNAKKATSLGMLGEKGQWLHVRLEDGKEAWVFKSATSLDPKPLPSSSPAPTAQTKPKPM